MRKPLQVQRSQLHEFDAARSTVETDCAAAECTILSLFAAESALTVQVDQLRQKENQQRNEIIRVFEDSDQMEKDVIFKHDSLQAHLDVRVCELLFAGSS